MKRKPQAIEGKDALELIEEAAHLLRLAPWSVLARYYLGALPFILGLLYFWTDMSRNPFAAQRCATAALAMALLYVWMKCWQTVFARQLLARRSPGSSQGWTRGRILRLIANQATIQPTAFFVLPVAFVIALPYGWVHAFYHNFTVTGDGSHQDIGEAFARARRQSLLWHRQNHVVLLVVFLFWVFVFINLAITILALPSLLRTLFGVETVFSRSGFSIVNSTFFAATWGVSYLCVNPLARAVYTLRCFYGAALHTGEDLTVELRQVASARPAAVVLTILLFWLGAAATLRAEDNPPAPARAATAAVSAEDLDRSISEVLQRREYVWRMPRERAPVDDANKSLLARFFDEVVHTIKHWLEIAMKGIGEFVEWLLKKLFPNRDRPLPDRPGGSGWMTTTQLLLLVLLSVAVCLLVFLFWRTFRQRRRSAEVTSQPVIPVPDLASEDVRPDQLPVDAWLAHARELMERGELRLALRALYLASLALLGEREFIVIASSKSNHEYERELRRRAHSRPELVEMFARNVLVFERVWYGLHAVSRESLNEFNDNCERIRSSVGRS